ncbi:RlpA-like double-psi beta-barrel-protein domain-containing protein-containing protein [Trametes meyenii]|nr:RlpA-like double-psi beta-barrel-protein domain-containing protein-containing protein [Trametes meyenii]
MRFSNVLVTILSAATLGSAVPLSPRAAASGTGDATLYATGLGSCGMVNTDADLVAAVDHQTFDTFPGAGANPNANPICNKQLTAKTADGKSVTVTVVDRCVGCALGSIDLSPTAFLRLVPIEVGRLHGVTWTIA